MVCGLSGGEKAAHENHGVGSGVELLWKVV